MLEISLKSDIGERQEQQDAVYVKKYSEDTVLMILCDGMGGFSGGSIASTLAVNEILKIFDKSEFNDINELLTYAMDVADSIIFKLKDENNRRLMAGTTCVIVFIKNMKMYWLSVGDSRLYVIRNGKISQITRDHTVELKLRIDYSNDKITIEEFNEGMKDKSTLCSYLGMNGIEIYDISKEALKIKPDDLILLASDGLYKSLSKEEILRFVLEKRNNEDIVDDMLCEAAKVAKGKNQDNTSIILCRVK